MKAFRLEAPGQVSLAEIETRGPRPSEVILRIGSASFCHSDVELLHLPTNVPGIPLPVTLGHEMAGWIDSVGDRVEGWEEGQPVAVHIIEGCGLCRPCQSGNSNLCERGVIRTPGVHYDGGMAERMIVEAHRLVPIDGLDVAVAAPLTDAGMTSYHSVRLVRSHLEPTAAVLVLGVGGLGHLAIQILSAISAVQIIAVDLDVRRVDMALRLGAHSGIVGGPDAANAVKEANRGHSVDVVLDFVGAQSSIDLGVDVVKRGGAMVVTGMGGGHVPVTHGFGGPARRLPPETGVVSSFAGNLSDLQNVVALAAKGLLKVEARQYPLSAVQSAWDDFVSGHVLGRVVVNP